MARLFGVGSRSILIIWLTTVAAPAQVFTTLADFDGANGSRPNAALVQGRNGNYYGTAAAQGGGGDGDVFRITPSGILTQLRAFSGADGADPEASLTLGTDGNYYGTTYSGGNTNDLCAGVEQSNCGTVFKITPAGKLTTLYNFCSETNCGDGSNPYAGLVQGSDGNFYGTTYTGDTVFKITPAGKLTTLSSLWPNGSEPTGLVQGTDGNFYGTTYGGAGTVFKISPAGKLTTLHSFCSKTNCADGKQPWAGLVQAADGNFYGTTFAGGDNTSACGGNGCGTVFKISPAGKLTTLYSFCAQTGCSDGEGPEAGLVIGTDGNFYGTTTYGGAGSCLDGYLNGCGALFQITPAGKLTTLYSFCSQANCTDGEAPVAGLFQATDGSFYGTTAFGGVYVPACSEGRWTGCGTVYSLDMGLGPFVAFVRGVGRVGVNVQILGQGFTGTTGVSFNGTPASFTVHRDTYLTAIVPNGATTGYVTVTTPGGTLQSNVKFRVRQ